MSTGEYEVELSLVAVPALGPGTLALLVFLLAASATARLRASR